MHSMIVEIGDLLYYREIEVEGECIQEFVTLLAPCSAGRSLAAADNGCVCVFNVLVKPTQRCSMCQYLSFFFSGVIMKIICPFVKTVLLPLVLALLNASCVMMVLILIVFSNAMIRTFSQSFKLWISILILFLLD